MTPKEKRQARLDAQDTPPFIDELRQILKRHKLQPTCQIDLGELDYILFLAGTFYRGADAFPEYSSAGDDLPDNLNKLSKAIKTVQQLIAKPDESEPTPPTVKHLTFRRLAARIVRLEAEQSGPPPDGYEPSPIGPLEPHWRQRLEQVRDRLADTLAFLDIVRCATDEALPTNGKPGPRKEKRDLYEAVRVLRDYWVEILGLRFTVDFDKASYGGGDTPEPPKKGRSSGRFQNIHRGEYFPKSAAAEFVVAALSRISDFRPEDIDRTMHEVRKAYLRN